MSGLASAACSSLNIMRDPAWSLQHAGLRRRPGSTDPADPGRPRMKATDLLLKQHRLVEDLFEQFEEAKTPAQKRTIFEKLAANLVGHDAIEREIFYPACEKELGKD